MGNSIAARNAHVEVHAGEDNSSPHPRAAGFSGNPNSSLDLGLSRPRWTAGRPEDFGMEVLCNVSGRIPCVR